MKTQILETKNSTYINFGGNLFVSSKKTREIISLDLSTQNADQMGRINSNNWKVIGNFDTKELGLDFYNQSKYEVGLERKEQSIKMRQKWETEHFEKWNKIKDLTVIPATLANIKIVLTQLNFQNWGAWNLPKMTIGYSANQFDCDGLTASTMKFDNAIEGETMFKVGGKRGYLSKYISL
jgi:hypothetical protein